MSKKESYSVGHKKKIITLKPTKKEASDIYKIALEKWPEFSKLEYQAGREEKKILKRLIMAAWVLHAMEKFVEANEEFFRKEAKKKIKKGIKDSAKGKVKYRGSFKKYIK